MMPNFLQTDVSEIPMALGAAWRWWIGELRRLIPERLSQRLAAADEAIRVDILPTDWSVKRRVNGREIVSLPGSSDRTFESRGLTSWFMPYQNAVVRFPAAQVVRQTLVLPIAARSRLRHVLGFELDRVAPIDPKEAAFGFRIASVNKLKRTIAVELWLVRKTATIRAGEICRAVGLRPSRFATIEDHETVSADGLFPAPPFAWRDAVRRFNVWALAGVAVVLLYLLCTALHERDQAALQSLQAQTVEAKRAADAVSKIKAEMEQRFNRATFLARQRQTNSFSRVLAEATHSLPDDVWVFQLEYTGSELRLRGYAPKASTLIELLDKSPLFGNAQFRAPVTKAPASGAERFDLSLAVKAQ